MWAKRCWEPWSRKTAILLEEHLSQRTDHRKPLFTLLAFDLWCDATFGEGVRVPIGGSEEAEG